MNLRKFSAIGAVLALLIGLALALATQTPRGRLNVMQVVSVAFFLTVILRYRRTKGMEPWKYASVKSSRRGLWLALTIAAVTWAPMIPYYFISDDFTHLHSARIVTLENLWGFLTRTEAGTFFRPVGFMSLLVDYHLWHFSAFGYHVTNLLLHLAGVAGVFCLCENLGLKAETAMVTSLAYGILPIQAEAVAWLGSRFDLLAGCLTVWAMGLYLRFRRTGARIDYLGALSCFFLAMLSKESGYVIPLLVLSAELFMIPARRLRPWLGFLVLGTLTFACRWIVLGGIGGYAGPEGWPAALNIGVKTLEGLFVRGPCQLLCGYNWLQPGPRGVIALASLTGGLLLALALCTWPTPPASGLIGFGFAWVVVCTLPVHFLLLIGPGLTNSRILYSASVGVAIIIAELLSGIEPGRLRQLGTGLLVILFAVGVLHNLQAWAWTSKLSRGLLDQVKQLEPFPPQTAELVFHNTPDTIRGVSFFRVGLQDAIRMAYGRDDVTARKESDPLSLSSATPDGRPVINLVWKAETGTLIKVKGTNQREIISLSAFNPRARKRWHGSIALLIRQLARSDQNK